MLTNGKLQKLRKTVQLHINWLTAAVLGEGMLTKTERDELSKLKLPKVDLDLAQKSFLLGRLKSTLKSSEWKNLDFLTLSEEGKTLTPDEKNLVQISRMRLIKHIQSLGADVLKSLFAGLEVQKPSVVGSSLKKVAKKKVEPVWTKASRTEFHRTKIEGIAQAIIQKHDIFVNSDGIDSKVSIVPNPGTCPDCAKHYIQNDGNPKIFKLSDLVSAGSNADSGVSHSKTKGIHTGWKTTLPPLHPNCRCHLVYIPPGFKWVNGKLKLVDRAKLQKALEGTMKSPTAPSQNPPSIPGVKAPQQATQPSKPEGPSSDSKMSCPFGGGDECAKHGGPPGGAKTHEPGGSAMKEHMKALRSGAKPSDPEAAQALTSHQIEQAKQRGAQIRDHAKMLNHLDNGEIIHEQDTSQGVKGAKIVTIGGSGRACKKYNGELDPRMRRLRDEGGSISQGWASVPHDTYAYREQAAYAMATGILGDKDLVPPTTTREFDGETHSMQFWNENGVPLDSTIRAGLLEQGTVDSLIKFSMSKGLSKEEAENQLNTLGSFHLLCGACDGHLGNILLDKETGKLQSIDMGASLPNGMDGVHSGMHRLIHRQGRKLKIPEKMQERLKKTSLGDLKRSLGPKFDDWEVGQQFLRGQYLLHLQEKEGHLDYQKFQPTAGLGDGSARAALGVEGNKFQAFQEMKDKKQDPQTLFEGFCKAWLDQAMSDPSHPHHETAKELDGIGVFMPPEGTAQRGKQLRAEGKHLEYAKTVEAAWPEDRMPSPRAKPQVSSDDALQGQGTIKEPVEPKRDDIKKGLYLRPELLTRGASLVRLEEI